MQRSNSIKPIQLALVVFIAQTGIGIITLPSSLAKDAGHDGWISLLISGILILLLSTMIYLLMNRYTDKSIYDITNFIFGKILGTGINTLLILYLLLAAVTGVSLFTYYIRITLLQQTPAWVLAPVITLPSFYLVWQGLKNMSRFLYISFTGYFIVIIYLLALHSEYRISFLLPAGEAGISRILLSMKSAFFSFVGFELIAFFYPYIQERTKILKWYLLASLGSLVFFLLVTTCITAIFGEHFLTVLSIPFFNLSRIYNAPVFERIDIYLIAVWFMPMACSMRNYLFAAFDGLQKVYKLEKTRVMFLFYFIVVEVLSLLPKDLNQVLKLIEIINLVCMGIALYLLLCLPLSYIRKKGATAK